LADFSVASDVSVRFLVQVGNEFLSEPDVCDLPPSARRGTVVRGRIQIRSGDRSPFEPEDELTALVLNLCYRAVIRLLEDYHAVVAYTDTYGYMRLDLEADTVRISGDHLPDGRLLAKPLIEGLLDCGSRFRAWLQTCDRAADADYIERVERELEEAEAEARRVWASHRSQFSR
jgi:hypothetical protein